MITPRTHLGDAHNFGRRVTLRGDRVIKPRPVAWERLVLSGDSPFRRFLDDEAPRGGLGEGAFDFLPRIGFFASGEGLAHGGEVERIKLAPLPALGPEERRALARITGRAIALFSFLGVADLHWENLALGADERGRVVFTPLDVEMIFDDMALPTATKLLPDADPEVAEVCRHAAGVRRVIPYLGKPIEAVDLVAMAGAYRATLDFLDRRGPEIARLIEGIPELLGTPIRVCLRGTDEYVRAGAGDTVWPPLLGAEAEQMARGDIPYFFRIYGQPGIRYYGDASLAQIKRIPLHGDVPQLGPLLSLARGLRAPSRRSLREEGLFTVLGAFDHRGMEGRHADGGFEVTFKARSLAVKVKGGEELSVKRDLRAFVGSVYLPCRCGEVREVFVPEVTACEPEGGP